MDYLELELGGEDVREGGCLPGPKFDDFRVPGGPTGGMISGEEDSFRKERVDFFDLKLLGF